MNILANSSIQILDGREEMIIYTFALTHTHTRTCTNAHILPHSHRHKLWMWGGRWLIMLAGRQESLLEENPVSEGDTCMHTQVQTNPAIFLAWAHNPTEFFRWCLKMWNGLLPVCWLWRHSSCNCSIVSSPIQTTATKMLTDRYLQVLQTFLSYIFILKVSDSTKPKISHIGCLAGYIRAKNSCEKKWLCKLCCHNVFDDFQYLMLWIHEWFGYADVKVF